MALKNQGDIEVTGGQVKQDNVPLLKSQGSQYIYVQADGTDTENATELQNAYNNAKNLVSVITSLSDNILSGTENISASINTFFGVQSVGDIPLGLNNFEVISDSGTEILQFDVSSYSSILRFFSTVSRTNVTSLKFQDVTVKRATVIASPSYYNFSSDFVMDEEYVDLVSLDGNRSVVFNGTGTINITANDVFVKGVDVISKAFTIANNLNLLKVENCQGGDFSFGDGQTVSGTFTDCQGGFRSFGSTASGTFTNCQGGGSSFGGNISGTASGTFTNCQGGGSSFGSNGTASGTFTNCKGGRDSFGRSGTASGKLYHCRLTDTTFQTVSSGGVTRLCIDGNNNENNQG